MKIYDVSCHQLFTMFASSLDNKARRAVCFSITAFPSIVIPQLLPTKKRCKAITESEMKITMLLSRAVSNPIVAFFACE